jgi:hypothetical protein
MNISLKNNVIWLSPERTGGKMLREIFKNFNFYTCEKKNNFELKSFWENSHSQQNNIPEKYKDFEVIATIRNPYDRIWSCYVNFNTKNFTPKDFEGTKIKFNEFVNKSFINTLSGVITDSFFDGSDYLNKWRFETILPDKIIKFENIEEDVKSLDFIKNSQKISYSSIFEDNKFKNNRFITFDTVYDLESARKVYNFYKNHFFYFNYNPFSFTKENLTDEEKINFLHNCL